MSLLQITHRALKAIAAIVAIFYLGIPLATWAWTKFWTDFLDMSVFEQILLGVLAFIILKTVADSIRESRQIKSAQREAERITRHAVEREKAACLRDGRPFDEERFIANERAWETAQTCARNGWPQI